jgi:large repetitive protein
VTAHAPGYHFDAQQFNVTPGTTTTADVLGQQLGTLTGTVLGRTDGNHTFPLGGVTVRATDGSSTFSAVTDPDGVYRITGTTDREGLALNSTWSLTASVFGYGNATLSSVNVPSVGGDVPVTPIIMDANPVNATIVVQADGTAAAIDGASVVLHNTSALLGGSVSCTTDGSATPPGSCVLNGLPPTTYSLVVTKPGFAPLSTPVSLQVGLPDQEVVVTLAPRTNTVSGTVIGQSLDGSTKTLWNSTDGLTVTLTSTDPSSTVNLTQTPGSTSVSGVPGDFSFVGVPDSAPGTSYVVTVSSNASTGFQGTTRSVTVTGGQVASVEIALQPLAPQRVTVSVTSTTGESMAGAAVSLLDSTATSVVQTAAPAEPVTTGATPTTVFNQVPQGTYRVRVDGVNGHLGTTTSSFVVGASAVSVAASVSEQLIHLTATSVRATGTVPPTATFTITNNATSAVISPSPSVTADNETVDVYVPPAAYTVAAALGATDAPNYSTPSSQTVTQAPNGGGTNWIQSLTFAFSQTITTSLTVTITGSGTAGTVTVKGGDLAAAGVTCVSSGGGTNQCTINNLAPNTYTVSATAGTKTGTVNGVTVVQGSNSVTVPVV